MRSIIQAKYSAWTDQTQPGRTFFERGDLVIQSTSGQQKLAFLWFVAPFGAEGGNVAKATLQLRTRALTGTGTRTIYARLCEPWIPRFGSLNYGNQPGGVGYNISTSKVGPLPANQLWEIDVTQNLQLIASGQPFYGILVGATSGGGIALPDHKAAASLRPTLVIDWSIAPNPPEYLGPAGGRVVGIQKPVLRWDFYDQAGETQLRAIQVQTSAAAAFIPVFDSGPVASTNCQFDLGASSFSPPAAGTPVWWRARNQDSAGLWSAWSQPASFVYQPLPGVTITNPITTTADVTPPIKWSYSNTANSPQSKARVGLYTVSGKLLEASGYIIGATSLWTPKKAIRTTEPLLVAVDVWDSYDREPTPGDPTWVSDTQQFSFAPQATVPPATNPRISPATGRVLLQWDRTEPPDQWVIYRDGKPMGRYDGISLRQGTGPTYQLEDTTVAAGKHQWVIFAFVNGQASISAGVTADSGRVGVWIVDPETGARVIMRNTGDPEISMPESNGAFTALGARNSTIITSAQRGWEGRIDGLIWDAPPGAAPGDTAKNMRDRLLAWKSQPGKKLNLIMWDQAFEATIHDVSVWGDERGGGGYAWRASFGFVQTDDFIFDGIGG